MPLYILHVLPKQKQNKKTQIAWVQPIKEIQEDTQNRLGKLQGDTNPQIW